MNIKQLDKYMYYLQDNNYDDYYDNDYYDDEYY